MFNERNSKYDPKNKNAFPDIEKELDVLISSFPNGLELAPSNYGVAGRSSG
jgi:hypothetical protein